MISKLDSIKRKVSFTFVCGKQKRGQVLFKKKGDAKRMTRKKRRPFFLLSSPFLLCRSFCFFQE